MSIETEGALQVLRPAFFVYLDIEGDPLYAWTGSFDWQAPTLPDPSMSGRTFIAVGGELHIGDIIDQRGGGSPLNLSLSGVDPQETAFRQIIAERRRWKRRRAIVWMSYADEGGVPKYNPVRKRTGRMNGLRFANASGRSAIELQIEGFSAHASGALNTRYSEWRDVDPDDTSQNWVHDLANKQPNVGASGQGATSPGSGGGGGGGAPVGGGYENINRV